MNTIYPSGLRVPPSKWRRFWEMLEAMGIPYDDISRPIDSSLTLNLDSAHSTHRHTHKKVKKVKLEERRRPGDQVGETYHQDTINDDGLREIDIEDANAHRFDDVPGIRKHIIHRHIGGNGAL